MSTADTWPEPDSQTLERTVCALFEDHLLIEVSETDADLFAAGKLDSLGLVELLVLIEERFGVEIPAADLDMADFRSVDAVCAFLTRFGADASMPDGKGGAASAGPASQWTDGSIPPGPAQDS